MTGNRAMKTLNLAEVLGSLERSLLKSARNSEITGEGWQGNAGARSIGQRRSATGSAIALVDGQRAGLKASSDAASTPAGKGPLKLWQIATPRYTTPAEETAKIRILERLALHFPRRELTPAEQAMVWEDYLSALIFVGPDRLRQAVTRGLTQWRFFPTVAELWDELRKLSR